MSFWKAARTSAFLSVLFLVVYGTANWISSLRSDVGTLYFEWERRIPFVPWMIVPYMSIDLFFFLAAFLCRDEREQRVFARRVVFSILVAAAFFLLLPLKLAWPERPRVVGRQQPEGPAEHPHAKELVDHGRGNGRATPTRSCWAASTRCRAPRG